MSHLLAALLAAATQDRTDLKLPIDTWYQVVQGKRPIGYVHETLRRSTGPWRFEYGLEGEFEATLKGRAHAEDFLVSAFLDDTLAPLEYSFEAHVNDAFSTATLYTLRDERRVEIHPAGSAEAVAWVLPAREDLFVLPALTLYFLRQNETLSRPGRTTLRALDPRGQDKSGVEIVLEAGESLRRTYLGKEATVVPLTFLKPFPAASRETEIREAFVDRFGRILEAGMGGGLRIVVAGDRAAALEGVGILHRHGRRDPFDRLTALKNAARERARAARGELEPEAPWVTLDSLDSDFAAARKLIDEARALKTSGDDDEARKTYLKAVVNLKAIRELALKRRPALLPDIEQARGEAELAWDGAAQVAREAGRLFVRVTELIDRLDVEGLERTQRDLHHLRDRVEVERRPEREQIAAWAAETGTLVAKCRVRQELSRARLEVTGITLGEKSSEEVVDLRTTLFGRDLGSMETLKFVRPFAMADVNGRLCSEGDTLEGGRIRVDKITKYGVRFSLRDEVREVGLHR